MVRFIAAISVITVCCYSSAVQAQAKPRANPPEAPVSRAQVEPPPPVPEQLLRDWAASSEKIKRLEGEHLRRVYDTVYEIEKLSQGRFYYETPDKGRINITPVEITKEMLARREKGVEPSKKKKDGTPFDLKSDDDECWACDGLRVYELEVARKEARVAQLPSEMQGANIMDSPLPFLFGMPPDKAKRRFEMSLSRPLDPASGRAYLSILPRLTQDAGNWASADVILDLRTFLPIAVQLVDPAGTKITVYSFASLKVNENEWIDKWFDKQDPKTRFTPDLRGFNINSSDGGQPEQVAQRSLEDSRIQADANRAVPPKEEPPRLVNVQ